VLVVSDLLFDGVVFCLPIWFVLDCLYRLYVNVCVWLLVCHFDCVRLWIRVIVFIFIVGICWPSNILLLLTFFPFQNYSDAHVFALFSFWLCRWFSVRAVRHRMFGSVRRPWCPEVESAFQIGIILWSVRLSFQCSMDSCAPDSQSTQSCGQYCDHREPAVSSSIFRSEDLGRCGKRWWPHASLFYLFVFAIIIIFFFVFLILDVFLVTEVFLCLFLCIFSSCRSFFFL